MARRIVVKYWCCARGHCMSWRWEELEKKEKGRENENEESGEERGEEGVRDVQVKEKWDENRIEQNRIE